MHVAKRIVSLAFVSLFTLGAARNAAADAKEAMEQLKALNQSAASAYQDGDFEKTKSQLQEAITVAKENGLSSNRMMAQVYILFGVLKINEHKDTAAGVRYFAKAIDISPAVKIRRRWPRRRSRRRSRRPRTWIRRPSAIWARPRRHRRPRSHRRKNPRRKPRPPRPKPRSRREQEKQDKAEKAAAAAAEKKQEEADRKQAEAERKQAAAERQKSDAETTKLVDELAQAKVSESQLKVDRDKLKSQLGEAKSLPAAAGEGKGRQGQAGRRRQRQDPAAREGQGRRDAKLGPAGAKIQQLEKDKAEKDKRIAALTASDKKERDAKEAAPEGKDRARQAAAEAKARIQQLEKDKADRDKQIASFSASDKKEREAREKLEKTMADVAARERERRSKEIEDRRSGRSWWRAASCPATSASPCTATCPTRCPRARTFTSTASRSPASAPRCWRSITGRRGMALYNAVTLERSRKGWYVTTIPGGRVSGRLIHYYVEARDGKREGRRQQRQGHLAQRHHHPPAAGGLTKGPRPEITAAAIQ